MSAAIMQEHIMLQYLLITINNLTWQCEVSACGLVGDSVADNVEMFLEGLTQCSVSLGNILFLTLGAGDDVDNMF